MAALWGVTRFTEMFRSTVPCALHEMNSGHRGHSFEVIQRENERIVDKAVNHQLVMVRINGRHPGVKHLIVKRRWCNNPVEILKRSITCAAGRVCAGRKYRAVFSNGDLSP